ncbi:heparan-alpha-glucosaminide N-acetyltransferase domain-containing protein [Mycetocola reblochoni]|uniref:heparan-alpha-glucosaminide N-acetyltransferase domain-containing protein n=1 Tax=Mycetocola reblochoni TaxID=331618 RepID=UPI003F9E7972
MAARARLDGLDLARGLALVGMLAAHTLSAGELVWGDPSTWIGVVDGRSSILFATVAGVSLALMSGRESPPAGQDLVAARVRLLTRAVIVFAVGSLLNLAGAPVAVILEYYAVCMMLCIPLLRLDWQRLAIVAAVAAVAGPVLLRVLIVPVDAAPGIGTLTELLVQGYYPVVVWFAFFAAGLALGRAGADRRAVQRSALFGGTALAVVGYGLGAILPESVASSTAGLGATGWDSVLSAAPHSGGVAEVLGSGGLALAVIGGCLLLPAAVQLVLAPLRAVGALALTVYSAHVVSLGILAAAGLPTRGAGVFWTTLVLALVGAWTWRVLLGRGPLERLVGSAARRAASPAAP